MSAIAVKVGDEVGTALGRLQADRPRLAQRLLDTSSFALIVVFFLRAFDMYCEEHALSAAERERTRFDVHLGPDQSLVVSMAHPLLGGGSGSWQGGSVPYDATGWIWARTVRLSRLLEMPNVMTACEDITRKLEELCRELSVEERRLHVREGFPKLIRGVEYLVFELE